MKIESTDIIPYPRDLVFSTLRDSLMDMVPYLPNIESIEEKEREDLGQGSTRILNWWKAQSDVPKIARAVIKPEMLHWNDHATWHEKDWSCEWRLVTHFFTDQVDCHGRNEYRSREDDQTEIIIRGDLTVDVRSIRGVPKLMAGTIGAGIEKFIVALITPNFKTMNNGLVQYLEARK